MVDVVVQNPQKSNEYEYDKKICVRRHSKMCCCCCCCRFCCGAPTTDERIHAPVLHEASQIVYCRYWGRASLPPITSMRVGPRGWKNTELHQNNPAASDTFKRPQESPFGRVHVSWQHMVDVLIMLFFLIRGDECYKKLLVVHFLSHEIQCCNSQ